MRTGCVLALLLAAATPAAAAEDPFACVRQTIAVEHAGGLPDGILQAMATVESGRPAGRADILVPWPWTINADGKPYFLASKAEAIATAARLRRDGARDIDVGCMQISLTSHPGAFRSLDEAFDPAANVRAGAAFLRRLEAESRDTLTAVGDYHSRTPDLRDEYRDRVVAMWRDLGRGMVRLRPGRGHIPVFRTTPIPDYPDPAMRHLSPSAAFRHYREGVAADPGDAAAAFGLALATERMGRLALLPMRQAYLAYARVLALAPRNRPALTRLLDLIGDEAPSTRLALLEQAYAVSGGPAALALHLAEAADDAGQARLAIEYRHQARTLKTLGD